MADYIAIIAAAIAGIFAIASAFMAWKLKHSSDERSRMLALEKERRDETKELYTNVFALFEKAIRQVRSHDEFTLADEFASANAKINLLAPESVSDLYMESCSLLESWSNLYVKASPRRTKMGDKTVIMLQAPDPTEEYKVPEKAEFEKLQESLKRLVDLMRSELQGMPDVGSG